MKAIFAAILLCALVLFLGPDFTARASQVTVPPTQINPPSETDTAGESNIEIESWTKPEPGWLYVLDPKPDAGGPDERIWLLDPENAKVMGSIRTGADADFALSPDGTRLYVASLTEGNTSELAVIDTAQGMIVEHGTIEDRAVSDTLPAFSTMAVSGDGLALRILIVTPTASTDVDSFLLATFDTQTGDFLPGSVFLGNCGPGRFISYLAADHFDFLCPRTNKVRLINVDADGHTLQNVDISLPWERRIGVAQALEVPGAQDIALVRGDGAIYEMGLSSHAFVPTLTGPDIPNRFLPGAWPISPDGSKVYLGHNRNYDRAADNRFYLDYGRPPNVRPENATAGEFRVYDTNTWRKIGNIKTSMPFWSAVASNDGKVLYAMVPQKHSILVVDTEKGRQVRAFGVGGTPTLALVAPGAVSAAK